MVEAKVEGHVRCMVGIAVWGRMYGKKEFGGEPGSLLLYIIFQPRSLGLLCVLRCCVADAEALEVTSTLTAYQTPTDA